MATLLDRRLPRVEFRAPIWMSRPPEDEDIPAQALNLSERGLFIGTDRAYEIGSTVRLRLPLGHDELAVGGRVAWTRPLPSAGAPARLGVEFTDLDSAGLERIKSVIGSDREHALRVRFTGLPAPIRARASVRGDGLSLHTELPFLRLGSMADFSLEGDAASHRGRIRRVSIEPGGSTDVPRLRIEVDVLGVGGSNGVDQLADGPVAPRPEPTASEAPIIERQPTASEAPIIEPEPTASEAPIIEPNVPVADEHPATVVPRAAPQWVEPELEESTEKIVKRPGRAVAPIAVTTAAAVAGFLGTFALLGHDSEARPAPTVRLTEASSGPAPVAFAYEPGRHPAAAETNVPGEVRVATTGTTTSVRLRLATGTTDGLTHYLLSAPSGVAINLPGGSVEADHKVHWTETGHAKKVWVRSVEEGDQVRVFFPDDGPRSYQVDSDGSAVTVTISQ